MPVLKQAVSALGLAAACVLTTAGNAHALNVERLTDEEQRIHQSILDSLKPVIEARRKAGTAAILSWEDLYAPLNAEQQAFLEAFRELRGADLGATAHYFGVEAGTDLVKVKTQYTESQGKRNPIHRQYLPKKVLEAYETMMQAMEKDLGKRLLVESGYRAPAYQLYLFLYYMPNHNLSIRETNRFVALPGHSEHGSPKRQAIDFINQSGINGEYNPEAFEALPEYEWLVRNAQNYGFALSYPRNNKHNTAFEPWHWHYQGEN